MLIELLLSLLWLLVYATEFLSCFAGVAEAVAVAVAEGLLVVGSLALLAAVALLAEIRR